MGAIWWTDEAIRWLVEIHDSIAPDNPSAAQRVVEGIVKKAEILDASIDIIGVYHGALDLGKLCTASEMEASGSRHGQV